MLALLHSVSLKDEFQTLLSGGQQPLIIFTYSLITSSIPIHTV